jgi:hypothetical protein
MILAEKLVAKRTFHGIVEQHLGFTYLALDPHSPAPKNRPLDRARLLDVVSLDKHPKEKPASSPGRFPLSITFVNKKEGS